MDSLFSSSQLLQCITGLRYSLNLLRVGHLFQRLTRWYVPYRINRRRPSYLDNQFAGFTLVEVLVAVAILSGALIVVGSTWSGNFLRVRKANLYNNAATLLEKKMAELRAEFVHMQVDEIPESKAGDFGSEFAQYRWAFKSQRFKMPNLASIMIADGGADQMLLTLIEQTKQQIENAVKEGTVTIFVKGPSNKEVEFSATTYFVNFTPGMAGGLPPGVGGPNPGGTGNPGGAGNPGGTGNRGGG